MNYDEILEVFEEKESINPAELEWNDAKGWRRYEILLQLIELVDDMTEIVSQNIDNNKSIKESKNLRKKYEMSISSLRKMKKECKEIIAQEENAIAEISSALEVLEQLPA